MNITKILSYVFGILLAVALVFGGQALYSKWQLQSVNDKLNEKLMQAELEIGKGHTRFGDAQKKIDELSYDLQTAIYDRDEILTSYGELEAEYEVMAKLIGSGVIPLDDIQPVEPGKDLKPGQWYVAVNKTDFSRLSALRLNADLDSRLHLDLILRPALNAADPFEFDYDITYKLLLNLKMHMVQTISKTGAVNNYAELFDIDKTTGEVLGKYEITNFEYIVQKPEEKSMFWWAPHVDIGAFLGINTELSFAGGATVGFTTSGYGLTKNDLTWKFFRLGGDISEGSVGLSFSPVQYNLGEVLPFISNLYVGPYGSVATNGSKSLGLILTV